jgi:enamine deaminase RidA (YjgF/YER057c/UK114 family)
MVNGRQVFIAGQVGWDPRSGKFESARLANQAAQALRNVLAVLARADGGPEHIARMTWYLTSRTEYIAQLGEIGAAYRQLMGKHFPAMTAVEVTALIEPQAKVEIEATAVIP